ncbi:hypothetical protein SFRURICE_018921 [Spodoptera frugiperda]|nr:hypothetical protein SFRURICE_018921 [Spodoptera frugiperda]
MAQMWEVDLLYNHCSYQIFLIIIFLKGHSPGSYASHASYATDFSLSCIETHTTVSTDPHRTDRIIGNAYAMRIDDVIRNSYDASDAYDAGLWMFTLKMLYLCK